MSCPYPPGSRHSYGLKSFQLQVHMTLSLKIIAVKQESRLGVSGRGWSSQRMTQEIFHLPRPSSYETLMHLNNLTEFPRVTVLQHPRMATCSTMYPAMVSSLSLILHWCFLGPCLTQTAGIHIPVSGSALGESNLRQT